MTELNKLLNRTEFELKTFFRTLEFKNIGLTRYLIQIKTVTGCLLNSVVLFSHVLAYVQWEPFTCTSKFST